jgi:hypothetical protein
MTRLSGQRSLLFVVAPVLLMLQVAAFYGEYMDDAFVSFRYGANLASGRGLTFNPGEKMMGSTSPGQCLIAASLHLAVGHDRLPQTMVVVGCIGWLAQSLALFLLLQPALDTIGAGFVAGCIAVGAARSYSWVSMETNVVAALTMFAILAATRSRWRTAAVLVAAAGLVRPDAFLLAPLLALPCLRDLKRRAWKPAALLVACALPWFLFAYWYFGTALPHSAATKFQRTDFATYGLHILTYPPLSAIPYAPETISTVVAAWLLAIAGGVILVARQRYLWLLPAYGGCQLLAYLCLRPWLQHLWHLYPGVLIFTVLCLAPIGALCRWVRSRVPSRASQQLSGTGRPETDGRVVFPPLSRLWKQDTRHLGRLAVVALMATVVLAYGAQTYTASRASATAYWGGCRHRTYVAVSAFLRQHARPGDTVAAVEVGTIGYFSGMRMYDLGGLVTNRPAIRDGLFQWLVLDKNYLRLKPPDAELEDVFWSGKFRAYVFRMKD